MHLCIVWILAEICLCAGEPAPPKLGSLTSCWWRKVKGAAHCCSWTLWRKRWRWSWLLWLICGFGELFVPEGENGSRDFVVFSCCLSSFFWKEKNKTKPTTFCSVCCSWMGISPSPLLRILPPFTLLLCATRITERNLIIAPCSCNLFLRTMGQLCGFRWQPVIVLSAAFPLRLVCSLVLSLPTLSQVCLVSSVDVPAAVSGGAVCQ